MVCVHKRIALFYSKFCRIYCKVYRSYAILYIYTKAWRNAMTINCTGEHNGSDTLLYATYFA